MGNIAFVAVLMFMVFWFASELYSLYVGAVVLELNLKIFFLLCVLIVIFSIWLFLDARYLYLSYRVLKLKAAISTIDNIKGVDNTENKTKRL
ncbi:MAG: hypothetical protein HRT67_09570 [Flavobacteriaceae bacterium]|nr:hypothetical protein [Flavobacteriaceae bacterium]